jgi:hypothetical protein
MVIKTMSQPFKNWSRRSGFGGDASAWENTQEVARVELVNRCMRYLGHAGFKTGNGVTAALGVWVITREKEQVIV